jgi:putative endonuclease
LQKPEVNASGFLLSAMNNASPQPYWVYVLWSANRRCFYIGVSEDPEVRLTQHNAGVSRWTRGKGPWSLVWRHQCLSLTDARRFEKLLKQQKGGAGFFTRTGLSPEQFRLSGS